MLKALIKKQLKEVFITSFAGKSKNGKKRTAASKVGTGFLMAFVFIGLAALFFVFSMSLAPLCEVGFTWFYFAIMGGLALFMAVIGSAFSTYSGLFMAKDNELLLSMPIPPSKILFVRLIGVWFTGFLYELIVMVPSVVAAVMNNPVDFNIGIVILMTIILSLLVTAISCLLGWIISIISMKLKNKSFLTVFIAIAFIGAYYYFYLKFMGNISEMIAGAASTVGAMDTSGNILYIFGSGLTSNIVNALIIAAICIVAFVLMYFIMSKTFIKLVTTNKGEKKKDYVRSTKIKSASAKQAIFRKELKAFTSNATYMLNTGLGSVLSIIAVVMLIIKKNDVDNILSVLMASNPEKAVSLLAVSVVVVAMFVAGSNDVITPSISLESKTRWLYQSLPVTIKDVIRQKMKLHLYITMIPAMLVVIVACIIFPLDLITSIVVVIVSALATLMIAEFDLFLGMAKPNYTWTTEVQAIKQSWTVVVAMFGGWIMAGLVIAGYLTIFSELNPLLYLGIVAVISVIVIVVIESYVNKRCATVFND